MMKNHPHPGELLREDVLQPLGIDVTEAAKRLGVARTTLSRVLNGRSGISAELALRLEAASVSTARFWMTLQANYESSEAAKRPALEFARCKAPRSNPSPPINPLKPILQQPLALARPLPLRLAPVDDHDKPVAAVDR